MKVYSGLLEQHNIKGTLSAVFLLRIYNDTQLAELNVEIIY